MKAAIDADPLISVIFVCSPGNPTGTLIDPSDIKQLLEYSNFKGVVIVDEAYIDFTRVDGRIPSMAAFVQSYPNLIVLQTLSKSFGLAGIRFASLLF
jgi:histidinol-phosphate aminotransferase